MFVGHYGLAVWDTQRGHGQPIVTLWQGFLAVTLVDILWAVLTMFGVEDSGTMVDGVPIFNIAWSHSFLTSLFLAVFAGAMFRFFKPSVGQRGFWVVAGLVFSHWVLDLIVHRPDLPLYPGSTQMFGLGVWNFPILAYCLEMGLVFGGFLFWQNVTIPRHPKYTIGLWCLFAVMAALQAYVILLPGLAVQAGTYNASTLPQGPVLGGSTLAIFIGLTMIVAWIEKGRPSKFSQLSRG